MEVNGTKTVLAAHYEEHKLNSPNDVAIRHNGKDC
jgi:sugar lactone lactonase YvrE